VFGVLVDLLADDVLGIQPGGADGIGHFSYQRRVFQEHKLGVDDHGLALSRVLGDIGPDLDQLVLGDIDGQLQSSQFAFDRLRGELLLADVHEYRTVDMQRSDGYPRGRHDTREEAKGLGTIGVGDHVSGTFTWTGISLDADRANRSPTAKSALNIC